MIDTGATATVVRAGLLAGLGLVPLGVTTMATPTSGGVPADVYSVRISFAGGAEFPLTVVEAPLLGQNIQCLIGRDLLSRAVLVYIGAENQFTLCF